jgi:hypothetical protein
MDLFYKVTCQKHKVLSSNPSPTEKQTKNQNQNAKIKSLLLGNQDR